MSAPSRAGGLNLAATIGRIGGAHGARDLDPDRAYALFSAILAGEVPALELGAILVALRCKGESIAELAGFLRALDADVGRLEAAADGPRPVVLRACGDTPRRPDPTPLLALLLRRYGVPVLIHGPGGDDCGDECDDGADDDARDEEARPSRDGAAFAAGFTRAVMLELGVEPARDLADAQRQLAQHRLAYVPLAILAPGLATLLRFRARLGGPSLAHALAPLIDPFHGDGYRVVRVKRPDRAARMRDLLIAIRARALLCAEENGPVTKPQRAMRIETFVDGVATLCGEQEVAGPDDRAALPVAGDAVAAAAWITQALAGSIPVPAPVVAQLACCLHGSRRAFA